MTKLDMLNEMDNHNWDHNFTASSSYSKIKEEYTEMVNEYDSSEDLLFPNGRDYDAEDEDGI